MRKLLLNVYWKNNTPALLITNQGRNVAREAIQQVCRLLNVQKIRTTHYHLKGMAKQNDQWELVNA